MVGLNPSKFYGRLLPRPRIYCDVKFSDSRVDPPQSVNAALLEWAGDASWKMGGNAAKRKRMSGKIEGRLSKLRDMDESDDDEPLPPMKVEKVKQPLSFAKNKVSPASVLTKTPIERILESPGSKQKKLAPRRIVSSEVDVENEEMKKPAMKTRARRSRKEQVIEESDDDSDDDSLRDYLRGLEASKQTPNRTTTRSARLLGSPTTLLTPQSKRKTVLEDPTVSDGGEPGSPSAFLSPVSPKRKRGDEDSVCESDAQSEDSGCESDAQSEDSESLIL